MHRILAALLLLLPLAAEAQSVRAVYEVHALGSTVLELEARFEITGDAYRVETSLRTRGLAALIVSGEQVAQVRGAWAGAAPLPAGFVSEGVWRGRVRRIALDWQGGDPRILELTPSEAEEREAVPEALRRGTVDVLSLVASLARQVGRSGHCDLATPIFDGRRRSDFDTRSEGREIIRPWRGAWHGEALRCGFEGRLVAGFRRDQTRRDAAAPQRGTAWIAAPYAGAPAIPVRMDIPTRWFGTATAVLLRAEPS
ncbi:DUF3108 domain-containing protein [Falsiroseomonas sp.]|uniref:DUF3108 domain-containing protein n=1 Tax=Falsiroseomonas sp. TaxID=2870721 RepID=UPI003567D5C4